MILQHFFFVGICISVVEAVVQDSGENNPTPAGIAHGVSFKEKLETFSAMINKNIIHHPSPTTIATVPLQFVNTKMNNIESNTTTQREKDNVAFLNNHNYLEKEKEKETEEQIRQKQSKIYSIQHPPPVPSIPFPIQSPCSLPSATPPPPPPDTPSSSHHYSMPDTPNYAPPVPPPDTPDSCQSTPAPPPPPTPHDYIKADPHG